MDYKALYVSDKIKIGFVFLILSYTFISTSYAQLPSRLDKYLANLIMVDRGLYLSDEYKSKSYIFCIGISVNQKGMVDSVSYSDGTILFLNRLIDFKKITSSLKKEKQLFLNYKNKVLVLPVFLVRGDSGLADNLDTMEDSWKGMIALINQYHRSEKKPIILTPQFNRFVGKTIIN